MTKPIVDFTKLSRLVHDKLHPLASTFGVASGKV